jgi:hypothetical protein
VNTVVFGKYAVQYHFVGDVGMKAVCKNGRQSQPTVEQRAQLMVIYGEMKSYCNVEKISVCISSPGGLLRTAYTD